MHAHGMHLHVPFTQLYQLSVSIHFQFLYWIDIRKGDGLQGTLKLELAVHGCRFWRELWILSALGELAFLHGRRTRVVPVHDLLVTPADS